MEGQVISVRRTIGKSVSSAVLLPSLMLGVSACSDGDERAEERPSATASSSGGSTSKPSAGHPPASSLPSPTGRYVPASAAGPAQNVPLPVMPEEAKEFSKGGLEAFARHWFALVNHGYESGETRLIRDISGPACTACNSWYPVIDRGYADGKWLVGGELEVMSVGTKFSPTNEGRYQVLIQLTQDPLEFHAETGILESTAGRKTPAVQMIQAAYTGSGWIAEDVVTIEY